MNVCPLRSEHQYRVKLSKHISGNNCEIKRESNCGVEARLYYSVDVTAWSEGEDTKTGIDADVTMY